MLRTIIAVAAIGFVFVALVVTALSPAAWPMLLAALLVAGGCLFERRYQDDLSGVAPDPLFRPTGERFVDPETGRRVTVWSDPASGERRYIDEDASPLPRP